MSTYLHDKSGFDRCWRMGTYFGGGVLLAIGVTRSDMVLVVLAVAVILGQVIRDGRDETLYAIEHHHECPTPGCVTQRGHLGGHVIIAQEYRQ